MSLNAPKVIFILGALQFLAVIFACEILTPNYDRMSMWISDLGVKEYGFFFNASAIIGGLCALLGALLIKERKPVTAIIAIGAIGLIGVGLFPGNIMPAHLEAAMVAFLAWPAATFINGYYRKDLVPIALGATSLLATIANLMGIMPGLEGAVERITVYTLMAWSVYYALHIPKSPSNRPQ